MKLKRSIPYYLMILPGLLFFIVFKYVPMFGIVIAFKQYDPFSGLWKSPWVGLVNFQQLFTTQDFWNVLKNTFVFAGMDILFYFPAPIILALMLNAVKNAKFKKTIQTIVYMPHFISWVVIVSITVTLFSTQDGAINQWLVGHGFHRLALMTDPKYLRWMWVFQNIWQGTGWGVIIYLAAMSGINPALYEAAKVDGASMFHQLWHITLPSIRYVIVILFILRLGHFMDIGFEHIYLLQNPMNLQVSDVFDTFVYRNGILQQNYSFSATVGLFKSLVGLVLVLGANKIAKWFGEEGVY